MTKFLFDLNETKRIAADGSGRYYVIEMIKKKQAAIKIHKFAKKTKTCHKYGHVVNEILNSLCVNIQTLDTYTL